MSVRSRKLVFVVLLCGVGLLVVYLNRPVKTGDSLLTWDPCAPPCWQGLIPGESTREEVLEVLDNHPLIGEYVAYPQRRRIDWQWVGGDAVGTFWLDSDIMERVIVPVQVAVPQILDKYGLPNWVHINALWAVDTFGSSGYLLSLIYPHWGLSVQWFFPPNGGPPSLGRDNFCPSASYSDGLAFYSVIVDEEILDAQYDWESSSTQWVIPGEMFANQNILGGWTINCF